MKYFLVLGIVVSLIVACTHSDLKTGLRGPNAATSKVAGEVKTITDSLTDQMTPFNDSGMVLLKYSLLKDAATGKFTRLYLQSPKLTFHHEFLSTLPEFQGFDRKQIEALTYKNSPDRRAYIGVVSIEARWFGDMDRAPRTSFYVMSEELPDVALLAQIQKQLKKVYKLESSYMTKNFTPLSHQLAAAQAKLSEFQKFGLTLQMETNEARQVYSDGWAVGQILVTPTQGDLNLALQQGRITKDTVLILGEVARELPPCAGIISNVPITPGSHLSLLAQMYGIPLVYNKNALQIYKAQEGQTVFLSSELVNRNFFQFNNYLTDEDIQTLKSARQMKPLQIDFDQRSKDIVLAKTLKADQVKAYGGKAVKFGLLQNVLPESTLEKGVGIPLAYYLEFIEKAVYEGAPLKTFIQKKYAGLAQDATYVEVESVSKEIRKGFTNASISADFFSSLKEKLVKLMGFDPRVKARLKLRSSSNVEDGSEFNGAGLYDSEGVCVFVCEKDDFEKGFRKVWGSLYTARGVWARRQFLVNENQVGMGILAHAPFKDELFNGVVRLTSGTAEITTQKGEEATVTNAEGTNSAEVVLQTEDSLHVDVTAKGLPQGRLLMREVHYMTLKNILQKVAAKWPQKKTGLSIEAEWKLMNVAGVEKIFIKQVREVPKPRGLNLPDKSERIWLMGAGLQLTTEFENLDQMTALYRLTNIRVGVKSFTENQLKAGKLNFGALVANFKDKVVELKPGKPVVELKTSSDGGGEYWDINVPYTGTDFEDFKLNITLSKAGELITTSESAHMNVRYKSKVKALKSFDPEAAADFGLISARNPYEFFDITSSKPTPFQATTPGACSFSMSGIQQMKFGGYDWRTILFSEFRIKGILSKELVIEGAGKTYFLRRIHDGTSELALDLFMAKDLTAEDKAAIDRYGRYLMTSFSQTEESLKRSTEKMEFYIFDHFHFIKDNFKSGVSPEGCEQRDGGEDGAVG